MGSHGGDSQAASPGGWRDPSVLEATSWRLASELVRRHPHTLRILRTHPGGGQYDCLTVTTRSAQGGTIQLNRHGTIQVHQRFDDVEDTTWGPVGWDEYLRDDPREFLGRLESAAGLTPPGNVPSSTPLSLTYRVLAAIASTAVKSVHPIEIHPGFVDTSGYGGGPNQMLDEFPAVPPELRRTRSDDIFGQPGYRFWIVTRNQVPLLAVEQSEGLAWSTHHADSFNLLQRYQQAGRSIIVVALELLRIADTI